MNRRLRAHKATGKTCQVKLSDERLEAVDAICAVKNWSRSQCISEFIPSVRVAEALAESFKAGDMQPAQVIRSALDYFLREAMTCGAHPIHEMQMPAVGQLGAAGVTILSAVASRRLILLSSLKMRQTGRRRPFHAVGQAPYLR